MRFLKLFSSCMFVFLCALLMFAPQGNATPTVTFDGQDANLLRYGGNDKLKDMFEALADLGIDKGNAMYKSEYAYDEEQNVHYSVDDDQGFPGYYDTTFSLIGNEDGPSGAIITHTAGSPYISGAEYLLVKDGVDHDPNWYLFDLNVQEEYAWDGLLAITLAGFWPDEGAISFVAIYGGEEVAPVPEPATMLLLGVGLIGLAGVGRKKLL